MIKSIHFGILSSTLINKEQKVITYIADVLVGFLGSTNLMSLRVHVDLGLALLIHFSVLQLQDVCKTHYQTQKCISYFCFLQKSVKVGLTLLVMSLTFFMCCWYGVS